MGGKDAEAGYYVTHLECSLTGESVEAHRLHGLSPAGMPLLVRYDLERMRREVRRDDLRDRPGELWRYRELLPMRRPEEAVRLGEVMTPLVPLPRLGGAKAFSDELETAPARSPTRPPQDTAVGWPGGGAGWSEQRGKRSNLWVKDEGRLPTGSFKARGLSLAVAMAREFGVRHMAMPTNGNAGAALAAYCARAGIAYTIFCPADTPAVNLAEMALPGGRVWRVDGLIDACGRRVAEAAEAEGWQDVATLKEPYRIEGKKTMGFELVEQLGWRFPDVIFYPTGGGTGLIGMWKAFAELSALGWARGRPPRMVAVQAEGCAPIVKAFEAGAEHADPWPEARTLAAGIRVPAAIGDFLMLRALRESDGFAAAVSDEAIMAARQEVARAEGLLVCPEGAATYAAYKDALAAGRVGAEETAVLFNSATGLKYPLPDGSTAPESGAPGGNTVPTRRS